MLYKVNKERLDNPTGTEVPFCIQYFKKLQEATTSLSDQFIKANYNLCLYA